MSHTTEVHNPPGASWTFRHDGDPSGGTVDIFAPDGQSVKVPFDVLAEFVGQMMARMEIQELEQLSGRQWLRRMRIVGDD